MSKEFTARLGWVCASAAEALYAVIEFPLGCSGGFLPDPGVQVVVDPGTEPEEVARILAIVKGEYALAYRRVNEWRAVEVGKHYAGGMILVIYQRESGANPATR